jgi:signal transduction histidine kinase
MQRRQFLSLFTGVATGAPFAARAQPKNPTQTLNEIEGMRQQLAESRQQTMQLLSMISEMRKPLAIIHGYTDLIRDNSYEDTPDEVRFALQRIESGSKYAAELINAAFDLSKKRRHHGAG